MKEGTMKKGPVGRRVRIPVRLVEGKWEFLFGGEVPVKNGTGAELVVNRSSIADPSFLEKLNFKEAHKVLDENSCLLVELNDKYGYPPAEIVRKHLKRREELEDDVMTETIDPKTYFVEVWIGAANENQQKRLDTTSGGLWMVTQGFDSIGLESTTIRLPDGVTPNPVRSLNHAYTRLSELIERWRISHTGNIYKHVLYKEKNNKWYPLELLRNRVLVKKEHEIAQALWNVFLAKMTTAHSR
jgi:hypothetical protein